MTTGKIFVTGASGFVGSYVVKELLQHGYEVIGLHRKGSDLGALEERSKASGADEKLTLAVGDICDPESLRKACEGGIDGIIHIAALFREAKHGDDVYRAVNIGGTDNVIKIADEFGVPIVHCSTVGVHSHIPHPPAKEDEPYRPADIYQETKCEGEKLALDWFTKRGVKGAVIRPAMIWGPGDSRTLKLFKGIAKKRFPYIGWGKTYLHWVSVIDLATSFRLAFEALRDQKIESGEVFIISGREAVTLGEMLTQIAKGCNTSPPRLRIPALPVQLAGSLCELLCKPFGIEPPLYRRRVDFFTKTRWFDSSKAEQKLGYKARGELSDEIQENLAWYLDNGWIDLTQTGTLKEASNL